MSHRPGALYCAALDERLAVAAQALRAGRRTREVRRVGIAHATIVVAGCLGPKARAPEAVALNGTRGM